MIRVIGIPTCPTYCEDRHRSGQVPDGRRTTIGITPRVGTREDVRSCPPAWMSPFASRRAIWRATGPGSKPAFLGNSTDRLRALTGKVLGDCAVASASGANEASVSEHFQPMRVRLPGQELGRCLSHALGTITSLQPPVVQEELQQRQVIRAQVSPEEEVTPKPAVEVLHQRTGPDRPFGQRGHRRLDLVEPTAKSLSDGRFLGPAPRVALVACQDAEELPKQFRGRPGTPAPTAPSPRRARVRRPAGRPAGSPTAGRSAPADGDSTTHGSSVRPPRSRTAARRSAEHGPATARMSSRSQPINSATSSERAMAASLAARARHRS